MTGQMKSVCPHKRKVHTERNYE